MEAVCSSKTACYFQQTTHRYIPEYRTLHNKMYENFKSHNTFILMRKLILNYERSSGTHPYNKIWLVLSFNAEILTKATIAEKKWEQEDRYRIKFLQSKWISKLVNSIKREIIVLVWSYKRKHTYGFTQKKLEGLSFLDISHWPMFYLKHIFETRSCFNFQVKAYLVAYNWQTPSWKTMVWPGTIMHWEEGKDPTIKKGKACQ
jgi:hypothetical protein